MLIVLFGWLARQLEQRDGPAGHTTVYNLCDFRQATRLCIIFAILEIKKEIPNSMLDKGRVSGFRISTWQSEEQPCHGQELPLEPRANTVCSSTGWKANRGEFWQDVRLLHGLRETLIMGT